MQSHRAERRLVRGLRVGVIAFLALVGSWVVFSGVRAQEAAPPLAEPAAVRPPAVRQALADEQARHAARMKQLQQLRANLAAAGVGAEPLAEVDRLLRAEEADHAARVRTFDGWSEPADDDINGLSRLWTRQAGQLAYAIQRTNQSYVLAPVVGVSSSTGGSYYTDLDDDPAVVPPAAADRPGDDDPDNSARPATVRAPRAVRLPPPVLVTRTSLPPWWYGEISPAIEVPAPLLPRIINTLERLDARMDRLEAELHRLHPEATPPPAAPAGK